jgi:hypothetical protein
MKANFITGIDRSTFGGALLYRLQGEEGTSIGIQLLVIWGYNSDGIYSHTWFIECESTFSWDKDKLARLYDAYSSRYEAYSANSKEDWSPSDNMMLEIVCETSNRDSKIEVIISEKNAFYPTKPLWIDSNR